MRSKIKILSIFLMLTLSCSSESPSISGMDCAKVNEKLISNILRLNEKDIHIVGKFKDYIEHCRVVFIDVADNFSVKAISVGKKDSKPYGIFGAVVVDRNLPDAKRENELLKKAYTLASSMRDNYWFSRLFEDFEKVDEYGQGKKYYFLIIQEEDLKLWKEKLKKEADLNDIKIVVMKPKNFEALIGKFSLPYYTLLAKKNNGEIIKVYVEPPENKEKQSRKNLKKWEKLEKKDVMIKGK